jgi:hypothetical protein
VWSSRSLLLTGVLIGVCEVALFAWVLGLQILRPSAPVWRNPLPDMAAMLAGFEAVLQEPWRFPPTVTDRLIAPYPISIVYTDSIPWLTLLLKASGLGHAINPLGLFYLLSYLLQGAGMAALLAVCGVRRPTTLLTGALLALLFPLWLVRQFGHVALTGHWLILFALALSIAVARRGLTSCRGAGLALLGALAMGVHAYHVVPVSMCAGAALLSELTQRRRGALLRVLIVGLGYAASLGASAWVLGYGARVGISGDPSALGFYSLNLAGPILPQASAIAGQHWDGSWFTGTVDPTGGQGFEGYSYLGAGVLLLVAVATGLCLTRLSLASGLWRDRLARYGPLTLGLACLTLLAVGPRLYVANYHLLDLPRAGGEIGTWLSIFRSQGRFFWAVGYAVLAWALVMLDRQAGRPALTAVCAAAVALQAFDVSRLQGALTSRYVGASEPYSVNLGDAPALRNRSWHFIPTYYCASNRADSFAIAQLSYQALRLNGSSNGAFISRDPHLPCDVPTAAQVTAAPGDRTIVAIFDQGDRTTSLLAKFANRTDCYFAGLGYLCGQGLERLGLPPSEGGVYPNTPLVGTEFRFDHMLRSSALKSGWADPDELGTWSSGHKAVIEFLPPRLNGSQPLLVEIQTYGLPLPSGDLQRALVSVDGQAVADWPVAEGYAPYRLLIPSRLVREGRPIQLTFSLPDAHRPGGADPRVLGIAVKQMTVAAARANSQ